MLLSLLYPWYLIPVVAVLALKHDALGLAYLAAASALGLLYYLLSVWAWAASGFGALGIHAFQALFLTLPIVTYLLAGSSLAYRERTAAKAVQRAASTSARW